MIEHSMQLNELAAALAKAQATVKGAKKDAANPFFKSTYADLASVWEACREALTTNGLSVVQFPGYADGVATLDTMLLHSSGQWIRATAGAPVVKADAQSVGSAITYLRRYALAAVASVAPEDDDGQAASRPPAKQAARKPLSEKPPWDGTPSWKGKPLTEYTSDNLVHLRAFCVKKDPQKYAKLVDQIDTELSGQGE